MESDTSERLRIFNLLTESPNYCEILREALTVEKKMEKEYKELGYGEFIGWQWFHCHAPTPTLHRMVAEKLLDITFASRSSKHFKVRNPELIADVLNYFEEAEEKEKVEKPKEIPDDLFVSIVGHSNIKNLLKLAVTAENPAHVLLSGPPASAKTLFLLELHRLPDSYYALGPTLSEAGLSNILFLYKPKYLIIDEIDRLLGTQLGLLNSLMATGRIVETKWGKTRSLDLTTKVFAAGIRVNKLPSDLLSRFIKLKFPLYSEAEFLQVTTTVLTAREGLIPEAADKIATALWELYHEEADVRQAVSIARLSAGDASKIPEIIRTIKKYSFGATLI